MEGIQTEDKVFQHEFSRNMDGKLNLAPMVRMNTQPFRELCSAQGADFVFSEEIIDRKLLWCQRVVNTHLNTIDFVHARDHGVVFRTRKEEKGRLILQIGSNNADIAV